MHNHWARSVTITLAGRCNPLASVLLPFNRVTLYRSSPVEDGYWVMLKPLSPGSHVIRFGGAFVSGPASGFSADTTVYLTVQ